jgi:hypothetical protein
MEDGLRAGDRAVTKLTLSVEEDVIEKAKSHAAANGTSVSSMFTRFVRSLDTTRKRPRRDAPITRRLTGVLGWPPGRDYREVLTDALMEKHGPRK